MITQGRSVVNAFALSQERESSSQTAGSWLASTSARAPCGQLQVFNPMALTFGELLLRRML